MDLEPFLPSSYSPPIDPLSVPPGMFANTPLDDGVMLYMSRLNKAELCRFKQLVLKEKLRPHSVHIPWEFLRKAKWAEVVHLLIEYFPGKLAWKVARDIFTMMNQKILSFLVENEDSRISYTFEPVDLNPRETKMNLENGEFEKILAYKSHVMRKYLPVWNKTDWPGNQEDFVHQRINTHETFLPSLFLPKKTQLAQPKTVVILGIPGIGKTTLARQVMLSWAQNSFYSHKFSYAFYIHCQRIGLEGEQSFSELLVEEWPPFETSVSKILSRPDQLLLVLDGFEELTFPLIQTPDNLSDDWKEKLPGPVLLSSLLSKRMVPEASLLILMRPASWNTTKPLLISPSLVTLSGFSKTEKIRYFRTYFQNPRQSNRVLPFAVKNAIIFSLCRVPVICWIFCSVLKNEIMKSSSFRQTCKNASSVFTLFLSTLFPNTAAKLCSQTRQEQLEGLCCLAVRGMRDVTWIFTRADLEQAKLDETSVTNLLALNILRRVREDHYVFTLFIFQEYFAAMFYVLYFPQRLNSYHVLGRMDIQYLVENPRDGLDWLSHMGIFLFGLLNPTSSLILVWAFECRVSVNNKLKILEVVAWLRENNPSALSGEIPQLFYYLSETREEVFVKEALRGYRKATLKIDSERDFWASAFCLRHCRDLIEMKLTVTQNLLNVLEPGSGDSSRVTLKKEASIYDDWWKDICSVFCTNDNLRVLTLADSTLAPQMVKVVAESLKHPLCKLQVLLLRCVSPDVCHEDLFQVLVKNQYLRYLEIQNTELSSVAIKSLCTAAKSPECSLHCMRLENCEIDSTDWMYFACGIQSNLQSNLQILLLRNNCLNLYPVYYLSIGSLKSLALEKCNLSPVSCEGIAFCLRQGRSLIHLSLAENNLKDEGAQHIWSALQCATCPLRRLVLSHCNLTSASCMQIIPVLKKNKSLRSLDLSFNNLWDNGFIMLCEALVRPDCNLEILELVCCCFTSACCQAAASLLCSNRSLCHLDLSLNDFGLEDTMTLVRAFRSQRNSRDVILVKEQQHHAGNMLTRLVGPAAEEGVLKILQNQCPHSGL